MGKQMMYHNDIQFAPMLIVSNFTLLFTFLSCLKQEWHLKCIHYIVVAAFNGKCAESRQKLFVGELVNLLNSVMYQFCTESNYLKLNFRVSINNLDRSQEAEMQIYDTREIFEYYMIKYYYLNTSNKQKNNELCNDIVARV